jgi:adenylate kinase
VRLVLLGAPGSGKGTQGQQLASALGIPHVSTGSIVRDHIARQTEFGCKVEAAIAAGNFAPDSDILYWVGQRLSEPKALQGYILDGFPRDIAQAKAWDDMTQRQKTPLDAVVELCIPEETLITRLSGRLVCPRDGTTYQESLRPPRVPGHCDLDGAALVRRPDDEPEAIRHRLLVYETMTLPLRFFYAVQGLLRSVDANGDVQSVTLRILASLQGAEYATIEV